MSRVIAARLPLEMERRLKLCSAEDAEREAPDRALRDRHEHHVASSANIVAEKRKMP